MAPVRPIFYISDGTGITAEAVGHSLLTQFGEIDFVAERLPFVDSAEKAHAVVTRVRGAGEAAGVRPLLVTSCVNDEVNRILARSDALVLDMFAPFMGLLERELGQPRVARSGRAHGMGDSATYHRRMNAINYALAHDDGLDPDYSEADLVLVAVSRAGKTPTCVYLALHHGIRVANYPLTGSDLDHDRLPAPLRRHRGKLFGLTIDPVRLQEVRQERRPDSPYSQIAACRREVAQAEAILRGEGVPVLSTTHTSIEEIASRVMEHLGASHNVL